MIFIVALIFKLHYLFIDNLISWKKTQLTLKETGVKVENVTGVGLTTWGPPQEQGHLSVGDGLFGQIVENDKGVLTVITEEFAHGAARIRSQVLQGSSIRSGGRDDNAIWIKQNGWFIGGTIIFSMEVDNCTKILISFWVNVCFKNVSFQDKSLFRLLYLEISRLSGRNKLIIFQL